MQNRIVEGRPDGPKHAISTDRPQAISQWNIRWHGVTAEALAVAVFLSIAFAALSSYVIFLRSRVDLARQMTDQKIVQLRTAIAERDRAEDALGAVQRIPAALIKEHAYVNSLNMQFLPMPRGVFIMGSPADEESRDPDETYHPVSLSHGFYMAATHTTRRQFAEFVGATLYQTDAEKDGWGFVLSPSGETGLKLEGASWKNPGYQQADDHPVVEVTWNDAMAFCAWLSHKEKKSYRLPTEAEWEYASRAGTHTPYYWGDSPDGGEGFANCADLSARSRYPGWLAFNWHDGFVFTSPVRSFKTNAWGLYDMIGNVMDLCADYYGPYPNAAVVDPTGPARGSNNSSRVVRGGSWFNGPHACRCAFRHAISQSVRISDIGFRCALDMD